ncbi:MAG: DUF3329 domain-containing protein [Mycobacterium sp.]
MAEPTEVADEAEAVDDETEASDEDSEDSDTDEDDESDEDDDEDLRLKGKRDRKEKVKLRTRPWGRYLRRSAIPLLLASSLLVSGFLGWKQWQAHQLNEAGEQARQAAIAYAGVLTSIDSNNVDQNFRQVLDGATGDFKDMYTQSSVQLRQLLIDNKATAHGVVVDSAIASESMGKVVVLLFIDQTVTNTQVPDPRIDRSRIKVTMEKVDGRWRASKVQLL